MQPNIQKAGKDWIDETGTSIPFNRISPLEKTKETLAAKLVKNALKVNAELKCFYSMVNEANTAITKAIAEQYKKDKKEMKPTKGNFTWFNFDRTIKVEVAVNETIHFDQAMIASAREALNRFIEKNVTGTDEIIRQLINSAFANTKGGLDSKKVMSLLKFRSKIKDKLFQSALDLIEQSISRPSSKRYFRVWVKDQRGQYQNIDLNFNSL